MTKTALNFSHHPNAREDMVIRELKADADLEGRERWRPHETGGYVDRVGLKGVSKHLETDFVEKVRELSKRFPRQRIEVLFEGRGFSSFPEELTAACR
ncbi:MAG: hypothetical protein V1811_00155, partial [Candidatus Micrarchaeota archaeon]